jgi:hypothetical protein
MMMSSRAGMLPEMIFSGGLPTAIRTAQPIDVSIHAAIGNIQYHFVAILPLQSPDADQHGYC